MHLSLKIQFLNPKHEKDVLLPLKKNDNLEIRLTVRVNTILLFTINGSKNMKCLLIPEICVWLDRKKVY